MSDSPRRGKRGPAPSWKLGSTRAIRVPIVLADALLNLARRIDNGEVTLVDAVLTESDKQQNRKSVAPIDDEKHTLEEQTKEQRTLAATRAAAQASFAAAQASFAAAQASFAKARTMIIQNVKREKEKLKILETRDKAPEPDAKWDEDVWE